MQPAVGGNAGNKAVSSDGFDQHDLSKESMAILHARRECSGVGWRFRVVFGQAVEVLGIAMRRDEGYGGECRWNVVSRMIVEYSRQRTGSVVVVVW